MDSNQKTIKGAQSVYRVLNILEEVILCGDRMITPKELSASLDIPVATVHRLLMVLRQKNFVACDPATKKYHIGDSCLISPRMDVAAFIRARFLPLAERISRRFGYSTILYARSGYDAVCVERLDGWHPIQVFLNKTGDRRPLGMGSATLSILAAMPEDEAEMILTHNEQEIRFVLKTDFSALRGFLAEARRKGYASAQGMLLEGTIGVSHVLRMGNEAVGSIAIDAVRSEQWDKDQPKIAPCPDPPTPGPFAVSAASPPACGWKVTRIPGACASPSFRGRALSPRAGCPISAGAATPGVGPLRFSAFRLPIRPAPSFPRSAIIPLRPTFGPVSPFRARPSRRVPSLRFRPAFGGPPYRIVPF